MAGAVLTKFFKMDTEEHVPFLDDSSSSLINLIALV
jgi:hypothetical protein